jgi:tetratricopeptide (TPR) repeat protein
VRRAALTGGTTAALFLSFVLSAPAPAAETGDPCDAGKQALNAGQYAESVRLYRDCLATGSLDHEALLDAHYNAGRALSELGRYSEAAEHFARVVEIVPDFTPAMLVLASTLEQAGSDRLPAAPPPSEWSIAQAKRVQHRDRCEVEQQTGIRITAQGRIVLPGEAA